jgi:hypothetical protein
MAAAITQNTRRNAPAPIIRIESGDVLAGGAAAALSGFFERSAVFVRVGFFSGIKSSFTKVPDRLLLSKGGAGSSGACEPLSRCGGRSWTPRPPALPRRVTRDTPIP